MDNANEQTGTGAPAPTPTDPTASSAPIAPSASSAPVVKETAAPAAPPAPTPPVAKETAAPAAPPAPVASSAAKPSEPAPDAPTPSAASSRTASSDSGDAGGTADASERPKPAPRPRQPRATSTSSSSEGASGTTTTTEGGTGPEGDGSAGEGGASDAARKRRRGRRGGKRHKRKPADGSAPAASADGDADGASDAPRSGGQARTPRPAGSGAQSTPRQPRPAAKQSTSGADGADGSAEGAPSAPRTRSAAAPRSDADGRRSQGTPKSENGSADSGGSAGTGDSAGGSTETTGEIGPDGAPKRRRRRGGRGRGKGGGAGSGGAGSGGGANGASEGGANGGSNAGGGRTQRPAASADDSGGGAREPRPRQQTAKPSEGGSTRLAARALRKEKQRAAGRRPRRKLTEEDAKRLRGEAKTMLIHEHDDRTQIAVLETGILIEHFVARRGQRSTMAGNIYLGKVQNVLAGMEAAFIDFGRGRNGVLYAGEVNYSAEDLEGELPRIEKVLKPGQGLMVQVTKDPIGAKGARLTSQISIAGRYMVLAPEQRVSGISRRLAEGERTRLRQILRDIAPKEHGVIVRTAAEGASKEAIELDLKNLIKIWEDVQKSAKKAKAPFALYEEPDLTMRVVRDIFSGDFEKVIVDSRSVYDEIRTYLEETAPDLIDKLSHYEGKLPMFEEYRITEQLHKALQRKVWLPSGGSIVIDRTEAMTVIDVNTGKFTGKGQNLETTVFQNNLEAAEEIARQLRLRDIGGIIVTDFIDMIDPKNQQELLRTMKRALSKDKTRSQVFEVSNLGLIEMTRKKVSEGLLDAFSDPCPNCEGRGIVMSHNID